MENRVKIDILGSRCTIYTTESEEYTKSLAKEIHDAASSLMEQNPRLSQINALILVSLSLADSARKSEAAADNLRSQVSEYLEEAASTRIELERVQREAGSLRRRLQLETHLEEKKI